MSFVAVMRKPVFPEDEGCASFATAFHTRTEAEAWIAAQANEDLKPDDYYMAPESEG